VKGAHLSFRFLVSEVCDRDAWKAAGIRRGIAAAVVVSQPVLAHDLSEIIITRAF
jgi:hypothetical protein